MQLTTNLKAGATPETPVGWTVLRWAQLAAVLLVLSAMPLAHAMSLRELRALEKTEHWLDQISLRINIIYMLDGVHAGHKCFAVDWCSQ